MSQSSDPDLRNRVKRLIAEHKRNLAKRIQDFRASYPQRSLEEILKEEYGVTDIDAAYLAIDYRNKTELIDKRGNSVGRFLSYAQGQRLIDAAVNESLD